MTKAYMQKFKKGVEGGLFHVVLGTMDVSLTNGYPYLQVQLTGRKRLRLSSSIK